MLQVVAENADEPYSHGGKRLEPGLVELTIKLCFR
jgi:hypothetical protein